MLVKDAAYAETCLARTGYYRLSAYWYPFRISHLVPFTGSSVPKISKIGSPDRYVTNEFKKNTSFDEIHNFYVFDKKLRLLISDALERIEVSIRTRLVDHLGKIDPLAHRNSANFSNNFVNTINARGTSDYAEWLRNQDKMFSRSKEDFAEHFRAKYGSLNLPPAIWVSCETWDWGTFSHAFRGLPPISQHSVASIFPKISGKILATWIRHLNDIRNICAHHSRLWNRNAANPPKIPRLGNCHLLDHLHHSPMSTRRFYGGAAITTYLMRNLYPKSEWHIRFKNFIIDEAPSGNLINPSFAGFPPYWYNEIIWN